MKNKSIQAIRYLKTVFENDWKMPSKSMKCIELFARTGDWHTKELFKGCEDITLLEIDDKYKSELSSNFPFAKIHIEDSIVWSSRILPNNSNYQSYNLVSIDNPLGVFGKSYCENFNIIENVHKLLSDESILLINIVPTPYGDTDRDWQAIRGKFFGIHPFEASKLNFETILKRYKTILNETGLDIEDYEYICREYANDIDYFYYLCLKLKRK